MSPVINLLSLVLELSDPADYEGGRMHWTNHGNRTNTRAPFCISRLDDAPRDPSHSRDSSITGVPDRRPAFN